MNAVGLARVIDPSVAVATSTSGLPPCALSVTPLSIVIDEYAITHTGTPFAVAAMHSPPSVSIAWSLEYSIGVAVIGFGRHTLSIASWPKQTTLSAASIWPS